MRKRLKVGKCRLLLLARPKVKGAVYLHLLDRTSRFSIMGKGPALMYFYAKGEYIRLCKEISANLPFKKLIISDESLRVIKKDKYDY